jgi:hypothetical protein
MAACLEPPDQVELVELCAPEPVQASPEPAIRVQVSEVEVPLADEELAEYGIMALEAGDEALAYTLFRRATEQQPNDVRAWFWRAKTAESLDEVISCLERAHALEPANSQIKGNLDSAIQRREQARLRNAYTTSNQTPGPALAAPRSLRAPRLFVQLGRSVRDLMRTVTAIGAFGVGAFGVGFTLGGLIFGRWRKKTA